MHLAYSPLNNVGCAEGIVPFPDAFACKGRFVDLLPKKLAVYIYFVQPTSQRTCHISCRIQFCNPHCADLQNSRAKFMKTTFAAVPLPLQIGT